MNSPAPSRLSFCGRLRSNLLRAPGFFLATGFFGLLSLAVSCWEKDGKLQHRIARQWARLSLKFVGARVEVIGREHLRPWAIYASNHASYMDTPVIFANLPFQFRILAKQSLWKWPFIGWHLNRSGQIPVPVEEDGNGGTVSGLSRALRTLRAGMPLFIFPEGGRTADGSLQPFMNGPAFLAIRAQAPLIPMALIGTYELLPIHTAHFCPGPVRLVIGEPIETTGYMVRQTDRLTAQLRDEIRRLLGEFSPGPANDVIAASGARGAERRAMTGPRIAIPEPSATNLDYSRQSWPVYAAAVERAGGVAVRLPLHESPSEQARIVSSCSGVLLPGSPADLDPEKYGERPSPECNPKDGMREAADELLLQDAFNLQKPIFGICYGMQSMNVWKSGTLIQDLPAFMAALKAEEAAAGSRTPAAVDHRPGRDVQKAHPVYIAADSRLSRILSGAPDLERREETLKLAVNSSHHQAVRDAGDELRVVARSPEDNVVEAIESGGGGQFVLGVQWHPERTYAVSPASQSLFAAFVDAACVWRPRPIAESVEDSGSRA